MKKKKLKLRSIPFKGKKTQINDTIKNLSNIFEKHLVALELVEREVIGYQTNE